MAEPKVKDKRRDQCGEAADRYHHGDCNSTDHGWVKLECWAANRARLPCARGRFQAALWKYRDADWFHSDTPLPPGQAPNQRRRRASSPLTVPLVVAPLRSRARSKRSVWRLLRARLLNGVTTVPCSPCQNLPSADTIQVYSFVLYAECHGHDSLNPHH